MVKDSCKHFLYATGMSASIDESDSESGVCPENDLIEYSGMCSSAIWGNMKSCERCSTIFCVVIVFEYIILTNHFILSEERLSFQGI